MDKKKVNNKRYKALVAFDLDNTLLDHKTWKITASALRAIRKLKKDNILVVVASGRDMKNRHAMPYYKIISPDALVHMNGTRVEAGDEILSDHYMDKSVLKEILDYSLAHNHSIGAQISDIDYFTYPEKVREHDYRYWGTSDRVFGDPYKLLDLPVRALAYAGNKEGAEDIRRAFPSLKVLMFSAETGADIFEDGYSKADGIKLLCDYYNISPSNTYAFGDSHNDFEMIKTVSYGIAMGNAVDEIKEVADYVTSPIFHDGVYKGLEYYGLI